MTVSTEVRDVPNSGGGDLLLALDEVLHDLFIILTLLAALSHSPASYARLPHRAVSLGRDFVDVVKEVVSIHHDIVRTFILVTTVELVTMNFIVITIFSNVFASLTMTDSLFVLGDTDGEVVEDVGEEVDVILDVVVLQVEL